MHVSISFCPIDSRIVASEPWYSQYHVRKDLKDLETVSKYKIPHPDVDTGVVPRFNLDSSGSQDVAGASQFIEGKSRPPCYLHRQKIASCSTIEQHLHPHCIFGASSMRGEAARDREKSRMFRVLDTFRGHTFFGFDGGVQLFSRLFV